MTDRTLGELALRSGMVWTKDSGYLLACDPAEEMQSPHAMLYAWHGGKLSHTWTKFNAHSICRISNPKRAIVVVSAEGLYAVFSETVETGNIFQSSRPAPIEPRHGSIRSVARIDGMAYAVGLHGMIYRFETAGSWTRIDDGLDREFHVEAIHGYSSADMYAVGSHGSIWHFDGGKWNCLETPANTHLTCVHCAGDGHVYVGGHGGTLLKGRGTQWESLDQGGFSEDTWSIAWFNEKIYLSSLSSVYRLEASRLTAVNFGNESPRSFYHLSSAENVLWSIGEKDVMAFDGTHWTRIL